MPGIDRITAALAIGSGVAWLLYRLGAGIARHLRAKQALARIIDEGVEEILGPGAARTTRVLERRRGRA